MALNFPSSPTLNQIYTSGTLVWTWNGAAWVSSSAAPPIGYTGSTGYTGSQGPAGGYTGSQGNIGYTGSQGDIGYTGSAGVNGYTGSKGDLGYTGSIGIGYTGSKGDTGYVGSQGPAGGYTGSAGTNGYTGSKGDLGYVTINMVDKGTVTSGTVTFSVTASSYQRLQVGGALTIATSDWAVGTYNEVAIELVNGAAASVTWPTIYWILPNGGVTTTFANNGVVLQTAGTDFVILWSRDGGTTIYGKIVR